MSDLLTWLNAERLSAEQTYQAKRNPYHEGMVDALDRVIARVEASEPIYRITGTDDQGRAIVEVMSPAPPDLTPLRELAEEMSRERCRNGDHYGTPSSRVGDWHGRLTRALDALEGKS